jgi:hypothetical protein
MSPITNDPMASLSPEERAAMTQLLAILVGRAANRKSRLLLFMDLATALAKEESWFWQAQQAAPNRKQELTVTTVNGRFSAMAVTTRL